MNERSITGIGHHIPDEEISWAGTCPWTGELCFGTESGRLYLMPKGSGNLPPETVNGLQIFDDSINGVAFSGDLIGISSRGAVTVGRRDADNGLELHEPFYSGGAHGIVPMSPGGFISPLGSDGLLFITYENNKIRAKIGKIEGGSPDLYRLSPLGRTDSGQVFACAARDSGLLAITVQQGRAKPPTAGHRFNDIDFIDVCSLKSASDPLAVVALNIDGSLLLVRDVLEDEAPVTLTFDGPQGTAYSVLSAQGHIFTLSSTELVFFPNLGRDFLAGKSLDHSANAWVMPVKAVEAFLDDEAAVIVIEGEKAIAHDIASMVAEVVSQPNGTAQGRDRDCVIIHSAHSRLLSPIVNHPISHTILRGINLGDAA
jgi:hypothetical protein